MVIFFSLLERDFDVANIKPKGETTFWRKECQKKLMANISSLSESQGFSARPVVIRSKETILIQTKITVKNRNRCVMTSVSYFFVGL